jgi:hypothetical protein
MPTVLAVYISVFSLSFVTIYHFWGFQKSSSGFFVGITGAYLFTGADEGAPFPGVVTVSLWIKLLI